MKKLLSYLPTRLPVGIADFEKFAADIMALLPKGLKNIPRNDIEFVIATTMQRLGPDAVRRSKNYFVSIVHSAASKQVAAQVFQNIKIRQQEEQATKQAEVTASQETVTSDAAKT